MKKEMLDDRWQMKGMQKVMLDIGNEKRDVDDSWQMKGMQKVMLDVGKTTSNPSTRDSQLMKFKKKMNGASQPRQI